MPLTQPVERERERERQVVGRKSAQLEYDSPSPKSGWMVNSVYGMKTIKS